MMLRRQLRVAYRQLLAFDPKQMQPVKTLSINQIVGDTDKMLGYLIGKNIEMT